MTYLGVTGTVCDGGFNDHAANVLCGQKGFKGGLALGAEYSYRKSELVWYSNVTCPANASSLSQCKVNTTVPKTCRDSTLPAAVLCYKVSGEVLSSSLVQCCAFFFFCGGGGVLLLIKRLSSLRDLNYTKLI